MSYWLFSIWPILYFLRLTNNRQQTILRLLQLQIFICPPIATRNIWLFFTAKTNHKNILKVTDFKLTAFINAVFSTILSGYMTLFGASCPTSIPENPGKAFIINFFLALLLLVNQGTEKCIQLMGFIKFVRFSKNLVNFYSPFIFILGKREFAWR